MNEEVSYELQASQKDKDILKMQTLNDLSFINRQTNFDGRFSEDLVRQDQFKLLTILRDIGLNYMQRHIWALTEIACYLRII